jgi:hypothetical protein
MCISTYSLMPYFPCHYLYISFFLHLLRPTISVLNLAIFPCYSNLLLSNCHGFHHGIAKDSVRIVDMILFG